MADLAKAADAGADDAYRALHKPERTDAYAPSGCVCTIPEPIALAGDDGVGGPAIGCNECGNALNVDTNGQPFRRWPNDLTSGPVLEAKLKRRAREEMIELVGQLDAHEQRRLAKMPKAEFENAARVAIARFLAKSAPAVLAVDTKPSVRRRAQAAIAAAVDPAG